MEGASIEHTLVLRQSALHRIHRAQLFFFSIGIPSGQKIQDLTRFACHIHHPLEDSTQRHFNAIGRDQAVGQNGTDFVELQRKVSHYLQPILSHRFLNNLA